MNDFVVFVSYFSKLFFLSWSFEIHCGYWLTLNLYKSNYAAIYVQDVRLFSIRIAKLVNNINTQMYRNINIQ